MRNLFQKAAALLGAALAAGALQAQTVTTNLLSETTFDPMAPAGWGYGYFYGNNGLGFYEYQAQYYLPEDVDMTNGMLHFTFDLTDLAGTAGYGAGTGGPLYRSPDLDPAAFASTNRDDYIFAFDARALGLDPAQTSANAEMQVQLYYLDEESGQTVKSLQVNLPFAPTAEWKRFTFNLGEGNLGDNTTDAEFARRATITSEVRFNVNFHEPHNAFGYDAENVLELDNARLEVVSKPAEEPVLMTGVPLADWNFDDRLVWNEYHYEWSQNDAHMIIMAENNAGGNAPNTWGVNGSSGWAVSFDNTELGNNPPQWAGGGSGGSGDVDYSHFSTGDLALYRVTFDAKVAGLNERTNTTGVLQLFLDAPDDTLEPADENADADLMVRLDFQIGGVSAEWQTFSYLLSKGGAGLGSKANFTNYFSKFSDLRTQWQVENTASFADWGYDADNMLIVDNFKLERLYAGVGRLEVQRNGNDLVLIWSAATSVKLQESSTIDGQFNDVAGAASGYTTPISGSARFFRLAGQ
jgi:hypothetical protein